VGNTAVTVLPPLKTFNLRLVGVGRASDRSVGGVATKSPHRVFLLWGFVLVVLICQ